MRPPSKGPIVNVVATVLRTMTTLLAVILLALLCRMMVMHRVALLWMLYFGKTANADPQI